MQNLSDMIDRIKKVREDLAWERDNIHDKRPVMAQMTQDKVNALDSMIKLLSHNKPAKRLAIRTYDPKCEELAIAFLEDEPALSLPRYVEELAQEIQGTIENWIDQKRQDYEPPDPPGFEGGFADNH